MDADRFARIKGPLGDVLAFQRMNGHEVLGQPFRYELELVSAGYDLDFTDLLGKAMTVELELPGEGIRYFNGYITEFGSIGGSGRYARYRAVLRPWLWLLTRTANCRVFNEPMTVPDLVKNLFRERGFSDFDDLLSEQYRTWEYRVQYRESDFNFISRLLEQEGIYYYFKHSEDRHVLVLADGYGSHDPVPGYDEIPYYPPTVEGRRDRDHIDSWSMLRQIEPGAYAVNDFNFERPKASLLAQLSRPAAHAYGDYEVYDYPGEYEAVDDGDRFARIRLEESQTEYELFEGAGNARGPGAGGLFSLSGFPREDQNKEYLVVSAWYEIVGNAYETKSEKAEPHFRCGLTAIDSSRPFRAPLTARKPKVEGPQTAIVVGKEGSEIWTDSYGRVKVQFHWDRLGEQDENSSCWVRVAQIWAGSQFGAIHIPRIGQEVIVDFLEGDPDRPIVVGRVYNVDNMPPYPLPANQTQSGIKTRSSKGGAPDNFNEIRFEDKKGEEELHIQAERNMSALVKKDRSASVGANDSISVGGDRSVHVTGNLSVTVDGKGQSPNHSSLSVTGKHNVHASDTIDMDAPTHVKFVCGGSSITIEPGKITFQAGDGAVMVLDANAFTQAKGNGSVLIDANVLAKSNDGSQMLLDANALTQSSGGSQVMLDANVLAASSGHTQIVLDSNAAVSSNGDVTLDGMNIGGTGKTQVSLKVAASSVQISPSGTAVAGPTVNVNGTGMVSVAGPVIKIG